MDDDTYAKEYEQFRFGYERLHIVTYCARECTVQRSGEMSVAWMLNGWSYAMAARKARRYPTEHDIMRIGRWVEPTRNADGYRRVNVRVGRSVKGPWYNVPLAMEELLSERDVSHNEWYRRYEEIHPFVDGNGRSGKILFNWRNDTLCHPIEPPDFWHEDPPVKVADLLKVADDLPGFFG